MKTLLTCCNGDYMQGTVNALNDSKIKFRFIGCDIGSIEDVYYDIEKFYQVSRCDSEHYIDEILDICEKEDIKLVIPFHTAEIEKFNERINEFVDKDICVAVTKGNIHAANYKNELYSLCDSIGVKVPKWKYIRSKSELYNAYMSMANKKCCIKQLFGCGGRGFKKIENENELINITVKEPCILQEYLDGDEFTADFFAINGVTLCGAVKKNEEMIEGVARRSLIIDNVRMYKMCEEVINALNITGNIGFDLKANGNGDMFIIDANPRLTATISLVHHGGLNLPIIGVKNALNMDISKDVKKSVTIGTKLIRRVTDYFV